MRSLKVVTPIGIGIYSFEHLMDYFKEHSVVVALNRGENEMCKAVADFAIGLFLSCCRKIASGRSYMKTSTATTLTGWLPYKNSLVQKTTKFTGATIGIIGLGHIGYEVAKRAHHGFDMRVVYYGRTRKSSEVERSLGCDESSYHGDLKSMLPVCDFVAVCCASNSQTRNLLGREEFVLMKKNSVIVNIARGDIIDTEALTNALRGDRQEEWGAISGAGLDVTDPEPLPLDHELREMENVVLTPHIAWSLQEVKQELLQSRCQNLMDVLIHGKPPASQSM